MKQELRNKILQQRDKLEEGDRKQYEQNINQAVWELITKNNIKIIHSYLPFRGEVNLLPVLEKAIESQLKVICPQTLKQRQLKHLELISTKQIETGLYGTPYPSGDIEYEGGYDIILVPGAAFEKQGNRLGYGGGYYDTFLHQHPQSLKVGVCFPLQLVEEVPTEKHDVKMDLIIAGE